MNKEFRSMRERKKERMDAILDLIGRYSISKQEEIVEKLREEYEIETNQSAVSRDVQSLKLTKDERGCYALSQEAKRDQALEHLQEWFWQTKVTWFPTDFSSILLRLSPHLVHMAPMIAHTLETVFEDDSVAAFVNGSGAILLVMPEEQKEEVEQTLHHLIPNQM